MVDVDVFRYRIARLQETLNQLRELEARGRAMVAGDAGLRAQLERWLHLAVEGSMDLARQLISSRGWRLPSSNRDVFRISISTSIFSSMPRPTSSPKSKSSSSR